MSAHAIVAVETDRAGYTWLVCSCGARRLVDRVETPRVAFERHRLTNGHGKRGRRR